MRIDLHFPNVVAPKTTHHSKKIVRRGKFPGLADTDKLIAAKDSWDALLLPVRPKEPLRGATSIEVEVTWPWLKAATKRERAVGLNHHTSKPDLDNFAKTLIDRLVACGYMENDQQVFCSLFTKYWGDVPGVRITLETIG